jgi:exopolysaccharide biosynthesis polyprenyl glycosylphosphotransferase
MLGSRAFVRRVVTNITPPERILVIGDAMRAERLRAKVESSYSVKAEVVGRVTPTPAPRRERAGGPRVLGGVDDLATVLLEHDVHRVVIAPGPDSGEILHTIRLAKLLGVKVSVLPRLYDVVEASVELDDIDGLTMLGIRRYSLTMSSLRLKRAMDVLAAGVGLVLLAPLFAIFAVAIKVTSRGPVFFRQRRVGQWGAPFEIIKFRTMYDGADARKAELEAFNEAAGNGFFKIENDPRVTPVGRVLRRTCIDELPQLMNVVRGEMSLVGPRPLIDDEDSQIQGWDRRRLFVRPGMTGLWQVFGSARVPMNEMVKIDYLYGANWSVWTDVKILLRTFSFVVSRRGL